MEFMTQPSAARAHIVCTIVQPLNGRGPDVVKVLQIRINVAQNRGDGYEKKKKPISNQHFRTFFLTLRFAQTWLIGALGVGGSP